MGDTKPPVAFWLTAVIALIWNLMGCWNYILQKDADVVAQMPEVYQLIISNRPAWATGAFALSVFGGAVGSILMLLQRRVALPVFVLSLLGSLGTLYFTVRVFGLEPATGSAVLMSVALVWFAAIAGRKGWLR